MHSKVCTVEQAVQHCGSDDNVPCPRHMCGIAEGCQSRPAKALSAAPEVPPRRAVVLSERPRAHLFQPVCIESTITNCTVSIHRFYMCSKAVDQHAEAANTKADRPLAELAGAFLLCASEA